MSGTFFDTLHALLASEGDHQIRRAEIEKRFLRRSAILILDSSGFTRISRQHGIVHYLECLVKARRVIGPVLDAHGSRDWRFEADNAFAQFEDARNAVDAAFDIHAAVRAEAIPLSDSEHFSVCIGVGYGDVLSAGHEGCFGNEVNLASKLGEDTAEPGEVLLTEAAYREAGATNQTRFSARSVAVSGVDLAYYHCLAE